MTTTEPTSVATATDVPSSQPTPTELPPNTDALIPASATGSFAMQPASEQTVSVTYMVTTPRTGTTLHAEIRHDDGSLATSWWLRGQAGASGWASNGGVLDLYEDTALDAGDSFPVSFIVTAPAEVAEEHSVALYVRSIATSERGNETAVTERAIATFAGVPPASLAAASDPSTLAVVDGGTLNCTQTLPVGSDIIDVGEVAEFACTYGPGPIRLRVNSLTEHWEYRLDDGPWSAVSGSLSLTPASGAGGKDATYVIQLRFSGADEQVPPGSTGQMQVEITNAAGHSLNPVALATLSATRASVPTADDLGIACEPDPVVASVGGNAVEATCTVTGETTLGDRAVTLTRLDIAAPAGWTVSGDGTVTGSTLSFSVSETVSAGTVYAVTFFLTPNTCETAPGAVAVSSLYTFEGSGEMPGPSTSVAAERTPPTTVLPGVDASALDFGTSIWNGAGYPAVTGVLALTISESNGTGCASTSPSWSVQVQMSGLTGTTSNEAIAPDAFTYLGTQSSDAAPGWLTPVGADLPLGAGPVTIASGTDAIGSGGTWNAVVQLDPPDDVPPDTFNGSIDVDIINAP